MADLDQQASSKIIFYHLEGCPQCKMVERMLINKGIEYESVMDLDTMAAKGILHAPVIEVDGKQMLGKEMFDYIKGK